ncbi:uncharacterized protein ColSpa_00554 [Colletotrichum spaethianum]|uniref:BTB domain-containing protein n=1 Tax=Colletotrichum spaethianum TaxID=700344 RepID=A0AA37NXS5_9PEZI|nr:uncharacterized protein ColSpa_00554 [Colletotrichum spaethianum]GKT40373.1 hypothetical protein ColSpa_00554 [Colletotrichum spaethianum]
MADPAWLFLMPNPEELVTLKCGDKSFSFRKSILVKDSDYFTVCLANTAFIEASTSTIEFEDIEPELLGFYLHMVYSKATGRQIDAMSVLFRGDNFIAIRGGLATMVKLYQMADRFSNKPLLADLGSTIMHFAEHGTCPTQSPPVEPSQLSPGQSHTNTEHTNNPETLAGIIWWSKTYKEAYVALNKNKSDQNDMRTRLVEMFCRKVPPEKAIAISSLLSEDQDFIEAVFDHLAHEASNHKAQVTTLTQEVNTLQDLNKTSSSQIADLRCVVRRMEAEANHLRNHISVLLHDQDEESYDYDSAMSGDEKDIVRFGSDSDIDDDDEGGDSSMEDYNLYF